MLNAGLHQIKAFRIYSANHHPARSCSCWSGRVVMVEFVVEKCKIGEVATLYDPGYGLELKRSGWLN
jgi:hypothetical protein